MDHTTLYGHIAIFAMQIVGLVYQWASEGRRHRWQTEQRQTMKSIRQDIRNGHSL